MKIIAAASRNTFIVEMTEEEVVRAAGFTSTYSEAWEKHNGGRSVNVGTTISVNSAYHFHEQIRSHEKEAASAANTLRALADLIGGAMPTVVIPPTPEGVRGVPDWIVWTGGESPDIHEDSLVEIETRDRRVEQARANRIWWKHSSPTDENFSSDVIRYRLVSAKGGDA